MHRMPLIGLWSCRIVITVYIVTLSAQNWENTGCSRRKMAQFGKFWWGKVSEYWENGHNSLSDNEHGPFSPRRDVGQFVVFAARCYTLSVRLSVTSRWSTKTAKRRITQTTQHDSAGTLVFWFQRSPRNSTRVTPYGAPNAGAVGQNRRPSTNNRLYLENGKT